MMATKTKRLKRSAIIERQVLTPEESTASMKAELERRSSRDGRDASNRVVSDKVVCTIDLAASCAALADATLPEDACLDSLNVLGALLGDGDATGRDHLVQQDNGNNGAYGLRVGDWKLQHHNKKSARNVVVETQLANTKVPQYQLFNLASDPAEKTNVIDKHPKVAGRLKAQLAKIIADGRTRH